MKNIDWSRVTNDLLNSLLYTQTELSSKCDVTQQSISNWKNGIRRPGVYAKRKLLTLIKNAGFKIEDYKGDSPVQLSNSEFTSLPEDIRIIAKKLACQSKKIRDEVSRMTDYILEKHNK